MDDDDFIGTNQKLTSTLSYIPDIDKQFEILSQSNTKRTNKTGGSGAMGKSTQRYHKENSLNDSTISNNDKSSKKKN